MQQAEPMPDLVHRRLAHLVPSDTTLRHRAEQHAAAVLGVGGGRVGDGGRAGGGAGGAGGLVDDGLGEGAVAEEGLAGGGGGRGGGEVGLEVDVEGGVAAFAEGGFHGRGARIRGPGVVDGVAGFLHVERDVGGRVGRVEHKRLVAGQGLAQAGRVLVRLVKGGDEVNVCLDRRVREGGRALLKVGRTGCFAELTVDLLEFIAWVSGATDSGGNIGVGWRGARGRARGGAGEGEGSEEKEEGGNQHYEPIPHWTPLSRCKGR